MDLFDRYGSYNFMKFRGGSGIWEITGTATNYSNIQVPYVDGISEEILKSIDTFKNEKGNYMERVRFKVMEEAKKGLITPVLESRIKVNTEVKKSNKRAV